VAVEGAVSKEVTAIFETPRECRLFRHHPALATFLETRLPLYPTITWTPVGVDPRIVFLRGDHITGVVRINGKTAREIEEILAAHGAAPL